MTSSILDDQFGLGAVTIHVIGAVIHLKSPLLGVLEPKLQSRVVMVGQVAQVLGLFLRAAIGHGADNIELHHRQGLRVGQHIASEKGIDVARQCVET